MRVFKNDQGEFVVDDGPIQLTGTDAQIVLAQMAELDASGNDAERQKFLDECAAIYRKTQG